MHAGQPTVKWHDNVILFTLISSRVGIFSRVPFELIFKGVHTLLLVIVMITHLLNQALSL